MTSAEAKRVHAQLHEAKNTVVMTSLRTVPLREPGPVTIRSAGTARIESSSYIPSVAEFTASFDLQVQIASLVSHC